MYKLFYKYIVPISLVLYVISNHLVIAALIAWLFFVYQTFRIWWEVADDDDGFLFSSVSLCFWPLVILFGSIFSPDFRELLGQKLEFIVANKYYYLKNPLVIRTKNEE